MHFWLKYAVCVALLARLSTPPRAMASVEEATGLLASTNTLLGDFCSKGGTVIFLAKEGATIPRN
jgi:hypothetical protein